MLTKDNLKFLKGVLFDMDGVLWRGNEIIPGFTEIFKALDGKKIPYAFITNNSSKSPVDYVEKFQKLGVHVPVSRVLNSGVTTVRYLKTYFNENELSEKVVFVLGTSSLVKLAEDSGFEVITKFDANVKADAVIVGLTLDVDYQYLSDATRYINSGAYFVGCNYDKSRPTEVGLLPGTGAFVGLLEIATGVKPVFTGKPCRDMFVSAINSIHPNETLSEYSKYLVIGDRLDTDVAGAIATGTSSALVLSGVSSIQDVEKSNVRPSMIVDGISEIAELVSKI